MPAYTALPDSPRRRRLPAKKPQQKVMLGGAALPALGKKTLEPDGPQPTRGNTLSSRPEPEHQRRRSGGTCFFSAHLRSRRNLPCRIQKNLILFPRPNTHAHARGCAPRTQRTHADSLASQSLREAESVFSQITIDKIRRGWNHAISQLRQSRTQNLSLLCIVRNHSLYFAEIVKCRCCGRLGHGRNRKRIAHAGAIS